jgi:hypothetical protein
LDMMKTHTPRLAAPRPPLLWGAPSAHCHRWAVAALLTVGCSRDPIRVGDLPDCARGDAVTAAGICFEERTRELLDSIDAAHLVAGDFSGDANLEIMAVGLRGSGVGAELWPGSVEGPMAPSADPMVSGCSAYPVAGLLLATGRDDLVFPSCTPGVLAYPGGDAGFGPPLELPLLVSPTSGVVADIDADGDVDLVALGPDAQGLAALSTVSRGADGAFGLPTVQAVTGLTFVPNGIRAADFDGDQVLDLALYLADAAGLGYVLGSGAGTFTAAIPLSTPFAVHTMDTADFDGDGDDDIVYADDDAGTVCIWIVDGIPEPVPRCWPLDGLVPSNLVAGDLDDDGSAEVIFADATAPQLTVWDVDLLSEDVATRALSTPEPTDQVVLADLQGDGSLDLVAGHFAAGRLSIRLGVP